MTERDGHKVKATFKRILSIGSWVIGAISEHVAERRAFNEAMKDIDEMMGKCILEIEKTLATSQQFLATFDGSVAKDEFRETFRRWDNEAGCLIPRIPRRRSFPRRVMTSVCRKVRQIF